MKTATMNDKLKVRLDELIGGTYMYRARTIKVKGFSREGNEITIHTETNPVITKLDKLSETLNEILPVSNEIEVLSQNQAAALNENSKAELRTNASKLNTLEDVLMANIETLKTNPKYLPQAKEINSQANSMIKIAKLKVDMAKELRKLSTR